MKNTGPLLSIVIPCHNSQSTITLLMDSIRGQTQRTGWEVVFVDDHSTDHTMEMLYGVIKPSLLQPCDPRFKILVNPSKGAGSARNFGIENSSGKYLWFIDSDDFLANPHVITIIFDTITKNPNVDLFTVNCMAVDHAGRRVDDSFTNKRSPNEFYDKVLTNDDFIKNFSSIYPVIGFPPWNKIVKREFLDTHGIMFQNTLFCNDQYFSVRTMIEAGTIYMISGQPVYCWTTAGRFHLTGSKLRQTHPEQFEIVLKGLEKDCRWPSEELKKNVLEERRVQLKKSAGG